MKQLKNEEIYEYMVEKAEKSEKEVMFISAFCKMDALMKIDSYISKNVKEKKILVRFRYEDIISGVSDLEIYKYCRENGWKIFFLLDLHVKAYIFDRKKCMTGSANMTMAGLGMSEKHNSEFAVVYELEDDDYDKIESFFFDAIQINDDIYDMLLNDMKNIDKAKTTCKNWSKQIINLFDWKVHTLFMKELPYCAYNKNLDIKEQEFLYQENCMEQFDVVKLFKSSRAYRWLLTKIDETENGEIYFGNLAALLHSDIVSEPKPYRRNVKELLANLLSWVEGLGVTELEIDRPNYSQRIRRIS